MGETQCQRIRQRQAETLGEIARAATFGETDAAAASGSRRWWRRRHTRLPPIDVRLPKDLADAAVEAWQQDDDEGVLESETPEQRTTRQRAWTLALIGSIVSERGRMEGDEVIVALSRDVVDATMNAANDPLRPAPHP